MDRPQTSWQACLSAAGRPVVASLWPVRSLPPLFLWASEGDVRHFGPPSKPSRQPAGLLRALCGLSEACPLFLWASEGDVRHFGPPSKASRQPASLLRPLCGLSEACSLLSSYGLPKATLGILDRPQTPLGSWQACLFSWPVPGLPLLSYSRPASNVRPLDRPQTPLGSWQACLFSWPVPSLPLLFLWASIRKQR